MKIATKGQIIRAAILLVGDTTSKFMFLNKMERVMTRVIPTLLLMAVIFLISSCESKGTLDEKTAKMLEARYGEPTVVEFSESGTLGKALREVSGDKPIIYLRIVGPVNGADIDSLNEIGGSVRVLDLLDASIVGGIPCHYFGEEYPIQTDNIIVKGMFNHLFCLEQMFLPLGTTAIEDEAFYLCSHLEYIRIPQTVTKIGNSAFGSCEKLASLHLPEGLTFIGESAFHGCESLRRLLIPKTAVYKGGSFFEASDVYLEWAPDDLAKLDSIGFTWTHIDENPPRGLTFRLVSKTPTLHVPAAFIDEYKKKFAKSHEIVADDGDHSGIYEPTFLLTHNSLGPVKVGKISDIPKLVEGLYDNYERKTETIDDFGDEYTVECIYFMKDGQLMFKSYIVDEEITGFYVYPEAKNVSTWQNIHAGDSVKKLSKYASWFEWIEEFDTVQKCTDNSLVYNIGNESLKTGLDFASSADDFVDDATISFIRTK